ASPLRASRRLIVALRATRAAARARRASGLVYPRTASAIVRRYGVRVPGSEIAELAASIRCHGPSTPADGVFDRDTGSCKRTLQACNRPHAHLGCLVSVRQRVEEDIDTDGVSGGGELIEVSVVVAFAFERIAEVGVVRHEDEHVSLRIADGARVRYGAVGAALRRAAAGAQPEVDRRDLRQLPDIVEDMKDGMIRRHVEEREFPGWQRLPDLVFPVRPRILPP